MSAGFGSLLRAEWRKSTRNFLLTSFTIWIYPVGLAAFFAIALVIGMVSETAQLAMVATSSGQWSTDMPAIWTLLTAFPANIFPRILPLAFMTVSFAGEYQWGTWKNLVPRNRRRLLLLAKMITVVGLVMSAMALSSTIVGLGQVLTHQAAEVTYGPTLTGEVLVAFLKGYGREAVLGLVSLVILAGYAALAALITRSILGGLLVGFGLSVLEPMSIAFLLVLGRLFSKPGLINLYRFTPTFNLDNTRSWLVNQAAFSGVSPDFTLEPGLLFSVGWLVFWMVGLVLLSLFIFENQDITS
jgi:hypothetical protein